MLKKLLSAALLLATAAVAHATTPVINPACDPTNTTHYNPGNTVVKTMIAGSSALWTTLALGAFNSGTGVVGAIAPTYHYVSNSKFTLNDYRPTDLGAASPTSDQGTIWIVWDNHVTVAVVGGKAVTTCQPNVWAYINLDSVIGNRAFFGKAQITAGSSFPVDGGKINPINPALWGNGTVNSYPYGDTTPPEDVQALFGICTGPHASNYTCYPNGYTVNVAGTDIRPEDAFFASNRVNSVYDPSDGTTHVGSVQGVGFGTNTNLNSLVGTGAGDPLECSGGTNGVGGTPQGTLAQLAGSDIHTGYPGSTSAFHVVAFNIQGYDPFTCAAIPAYSVIPVGASPIVFFYSDHGGAGALHGLADANEHQLEAVFSGGTNGTTNADASEFGLPAGAIAAYLREPLSGTFNTAEETIFRHPSISDAYRYSQEYGGSTQLPNPLVGTTNRWRAIGTGQEVQSVQNSFTNNALDGIGYAFFSYGNVNPIAAANYYYIQVNGIDPIWHNYVAGSYGFTDPGQSTTPGTIPGPSNLPASCAATFPCPESAIWYPDRSEGSLPGSFPNLRNGTYPAWSLLRLVATTGTSGSSTAATALVNASNIYAVTTVPDYVPFAAVKQGTTTLDEGMQVLRSHFGCPASGYFMCGYLTGTTVKSSANYPETGRDAGGSILPISDIRTNYAQDGSGGNGGYVIFPTTPGIR
jgi:hypothetical protein